MADRRTTQTGVNYEWLMDTNYRRTTTAGVQVEYVQDTNYRRATTVGIMVEYVPGAAPAVTRRVGWF